MRQSSAGTPLGAAPDLLKVILGFRLLLFCLIRLRVQVVSFQTAFGSLDSGSRGFARRLASPGAPMLLGSGTHVRKTLQGPGPEKHE